MPVTKPSAYALAIVPFLGAFAAPSVASAASGLGNLTYTAAELNKPVSNFGGVGATKWATGPTGANTVVMIHQKLIVMASNDSGKPPGSFHTYDVSDPRNPRLLTTLDGTPETSNIRELHAMPVALIDGKAILVVPTLTGLQFFDFSDPLKPAPAGTFALQGVNGGDYDNAAWMLSWGYPYVFAGGTGNGIFVVDATDPAKCSLVSRITTGELGNFRVGPTYAAGNFVVGSNMDQGTTHVSVIDVGDPKHPVLSASGSTPASLYSALVVGDLFFGPGTNGNYSFMRWDAISAAVVGSGVSGKDRGGYCGYQSGFAICGQSSEGFKKWDIRDVTKPKLVGNGTDPNGPGGDFDFATILGNLVYLGNDHGTGSALIPHQIEPDTVAPEVMKIYPNDKEVKQPTTSRITVFFTEDLDLDTVNATNIVVRQVGGGEVAGTFARSSFDAITFGPKAPLTANSTYEVVVPAGGVKDLVGNVITKATSIRFATGATIDTTGTTPVTLDGGTPATADAGKPSDAALDAGAAGSGGSGNAGSGGSAAGSGGSAAGSGGSGGAAGSTGGSAGDTIAGSGGSNSVVVDSGTPSGSAGSTATTPPADSSSGCGCSVPGRSTPASAWTMIIAGLCLGLLRLVRRDRRSGGAERA